MAQKNTIILGTNKNGLLPLSWLDLRNGMLIAGASGMGKSNTMAFYLTQYAYNGAKIILCDYGGSGASEETLVHRIEHLKPAFYNNMKPATTMKEIVQYIRIVNTLIKERQVSGDMSQVLFVVDEFSAFLLAIEPEQRKEITRDINGNKTTIAIKKEPTFLSSFLESVITARKYNIRFIIAGQEWAQISTNGVRAIRSAFTNHIIHGLDSGSAKLFAENDSKLIRIIQLLETGYAYIRPANDIYKIPLLLEDFVIDTEEKLAKLYPKDSVEAAQSETKKDWTYQELQNYIHMLMSDAKLLIINKDLGKWPIETKEDIIEFLVLLGWSGNRVEQAIRGDTNKTREFYKYYWNKHFSDKKAISDTAN